MVNVFLLELRFKRFKYRFVVQVILLGFTFPSGVRLLFPSLPSLEEVIRTLCIDNERRAPFRCAHHSIATHPVHLEGNGRSSCGLSTRRGGGSGRPSPFTLCVRHRTDRCSMCEWG
eukprot:1031485-Prorocentrum_minimum.AAC.2